MDKTQNEYDGRANFKADDDTEAQLDAHFEAFDISKRLIYRNFPLFTRTITIKRFLAHYELFRMTVDLPGDIVELGVYRGLTLFTWAKFLDVRNNNDRAKQVFGFDNWAGFLEFVEQDGPPAPRVNKVIGGYDAGEFHASVENLIKIYDGDRFIPHKPRILLVDGQIEYTVPEFVKKAPGRKISLMHIDCDIYVPTKAALKQLWPMIVRGGVLVLDDYGISEWAGETKAVDEYFADKDVEIKRFHWAQCPGAYIVKK